MVPSDEPEVFEVLRKIRMDLTAAQAKLSEALNMVAAMNLPAPGKVKCVRCAGQFRGAQALRDHAYNVHGVGELCVSCGVVMAADEIHVCAIQIVES
jgi:hypothetical protein